MTIVILGAEDDDHTLHMCEHLDRLGLDPVLLDSRWFPLSSTLSFDPKDEWGRLRLPSGRTLEFGDVTALYWRVYQGVAAPELPDSEQGFIAQNDARGLFETVLIRLSPARLVNPWRAYQLHQTKPAQLAIVSRLGISIPATLLTNNAEDLVTFAGRHPEAIFKPVQGGAHTRTITPAHLTPENLTNLRVAPVTVQEKVPGLDVRVFVAGERVLACELETDAIDFREDPSAVLRVHRLASPMRERCAALARALELVWTGMDFKLTPDGRYVFLEANPSPMFLGFEERTGLPLTESLTMLLT